MKNRGISLFTKILFWLFLNLTVLPIILIVASVLFNHQILIHDVLSIQGSAQMRSTFKLITLELSQLPQPKWTGELLRFSEAYRVDFVLILENGTIYSSTEIDPNESIMTKVRNSIEQSRVLQKEESMGKNIPLLPEVNPTHPDMLMQTSDPNLFWTGILVDLPSGANQQKEPAMLSAVSDSVTGHGFIFDPTPWVIIVASVAVISIILWIPLVRHITKPLGRMTLATEKIAKGRFDVSLETSRNDEIGRLAKAIEHMSSQLSTYVTGQKRFLGDVAHELGSPIARIQFGLGALEQRIEEKNRQRVVEVMEEVDHMSALVHELLALSRIEIDTQIVKVKTVDLLSVVEEAVKREFAPSTEIKIRVDAELRVIASVDLLTRAISNLIRNSIKYAGDAGPITISSRKEDNSVLIEVIDSGPGVPDTFLDQLFEPFFRLDPSRDRSSGGVGLGLAIVKTCVENCQGDVEARNLNPKGFAVIITLAAA